MDVISELDGRAREDRQHLRALADGVMHREDGVTDVPPEAIEGVDQPVRLLRRHGGAAPQNNRPTI